MLVTKVKETQKYKLIAHENKKPEVNILLPVNTQL